MTEQEWFTSEDPQLMLSWAQGEDLKGERLYPLSGRKLRLFACACARHVWRLLTDERSRRAVEVAERYAEELVTEIVLARDKAREVCCSSPQCLTCIATECLNAIPWVTFPRNGWVTNHIPLAVQADVVRDIVAYSANRYPLRDYGACDLCLGAGVTMDLEMCPRCHGVGQVVPWITPTALSVATRAYSERSPVGQLDPATICVLADAMEDTGMVPERVLSHLRSPLPHWLGCHIIDAILGLE